MSPMSPSAMITANLTDLENLIRRVVREELTRQSRNLSILDDWSHEGPDDPAGDEQLLREAVEVSERYRVDKSGGKTLEEFEADLNQTDRQP
jgi:hypothetical protein